MNSKKTNRTKYRLEIELKTVLVHPSSHINLHNLGITRIKGTLKISITSLIQQDGHKLKKGVIVIKLEPNITF